MSTSRERRTARSLLDISSRERRGSGGFGGLVDVFSGSTQESSQVYRSRRRQGRRTPAGSVFWLGPILSPQTSSLGGLRYTSSNVFAFNGGGVSLRNANPSFIVREATPNLWSYWQPTIFGGSISELYGFMRLSLSGNTYTYAFEADATIPRPEQRTGGGVTVDIPPSYPDPSDYTLVGWTTATGSTITVTANIETGGTNFNIPPPAGGPEGFDVIRDENYLLVGQVGRVGNVRIIQGNKSHNSATSNFLYPDLVVPVPIGGSASTSITLSNQHVPPRRHFPIDKTSFASGENTSNYYETRFSNPPDDYLDRFFTSSNSPSDLADPQFESVNYFFVSLRISAAEFLSGFSPRERLKGSITVTVENLSSGLEFFESGAFIETIDEQGNPVQSTNLAGTVIASEENMRASANGFSPTI